MPRTIEEELRDVIGNNVLEIVQLRIKIVKLEEELTQHKLEIIRLREALDGRLKDLERTVKENEQSNKIHSRVPKIIKGHSKHS